MPRSKLFDKEEALKKAMVLFWEKGYHATSMQDLVDTLGISRGSLYDTFGGKQELFDRAIGLYQNTNQNNILTFFEAHPKVKAGLAKLFENAIDETLEDANKKGCFVVNTTTELTPGDEKMLSFLQENKQGMEEIFYNYLSKGVDNGEISKDKDLRTMATFIFTFYNGLRVISKLDHNRESLLSSVKTALTLLE